MTDKLKAEIEVFKKECLKLWFCQGLSDSYRNNALFEYTILPDSQVLFLREQARQLWSFWQAATAQAVPEGYVVVKPALDSAAKYKMIGEYTFRVNDTDTFITVPWTMIKQIYKGGIECMIQAAQEGE